MTHRLQRKKEMACSNMEEMMELLRSRTVWGAWLANGAVALQARPLEPFQCRGQKGRASTMVDSARRQI